MVKLIRSIIMLLLVLLIARFGFTRYTNKQHAAQLDLSTETIVKQLSDAGILETATMKLEKKVIGKQGLSDLLPGHNRDNLIQEFLFQDSLQMVAYADIGAGFDLRKITKNDIIIQEEKSTSPLTTRNTLQSFILPTQSPKTLTTKVTLKLPPAHIVRAVLTPETKPFTRSLGLLTKGNIQLETELRNKALEKMTDDAIKAGILDKAHTFAKQALAPLFQAANIELIDVVIQ